MVFSICTHSAFKAVLVTVLSLVTNLMNSCNIAY